MSGGHVVGAAHGDVEGLQVIRIDRDELTRGAAPHAGTVTLADRARRARRRGATCGHSCSPTQVVRRADSRPGVPAAPAQSASTRHSTQVPAPSQTSAATVASKAVPAGSLTPSPGLSRDQPGNQVRRCRPGSQFASQVPLVVHWLTASLPSNRSQSKPPGVVEMQKLLPGQVRTMIVLVLVTL